MSIPNKVYSRLAVGGVAVLALSVAACGGGTEPSKVSQSSETSSTARAAAGALAHALPASFKSKGSLTIGSQVDYPPFGMTTDDEETLTGLNVDLSNELATVLGVNAEVVGAQFDSLLPGVESERFDLVVNGFTDTEERRKRLNFVDYFQGGSEIYVPAGNPGKVGSWDDLCGLHVGVLKASLEVTHAEEQSDKCVAAGQDAVEISVYPSETATILALKSGRSDAMLMDSPVGGYVAKESNGAFEAAGAISVMKRKGIVVSKENEELMLAVQQAVQYLMDNGIYEELLKKWGLEDGAIAEAIINDGTGY